MVEPVKYEHPGTDKKCLKHQGVMIIQTRTTLE